MPAATLCERDRRPVLCSPEIHTAVRSHLETSPERWKCKVPVYCLMPDHLHVLVQGTAEDSDALAAVEAFKLASAKWMAAHLPGVRWQPSFYDHLVRPDWAKDAMYIMRNPWRANLIEGDGPWPYSGAIGYDFNEVLSQAFLGMLIAE